MTPPTPDPTPEDTMPALPRRRRLVADRHADRLCHPVAMGRPAQRRPAQGWPRARHAMAGLYAAAPALANARQPAGTQPAGAGLGRPGAVAAPAAYPQPATGAGEL